ncbi:MAG: response regulator [Tissierellaceae bacterium]|nr:response regulator [Tissierellaceae bacterium]
MRFLIVDDSKFTQKITEKYLREKFIDVEITLAGDGEEGFEKYKKLRPDYVFIDLLMPIINGQELIKLIKEKDGESKIFIISADVQKSVKEEMEGYGILGFINKPMDDEKAQYIYDAIIGEGNGTD